MLHISAVQQKIRWVQDLSRLPSAEEPLPELPARELNVVLPGEMPTRPGLASLTGQRRLLHDLANIELQAMELCYRSLIEYPEAPPDFREQLFGLLQSEASHLQLSLDALASLGGSWGEFPVHLGLWSAVRGSDSLLDRILIVHRYLEGNGLDAGETLLRKLHSVPRSSTHLAVEQIAREELDHVAFGSRWYQALCREQKLDPSSDFRERFTRLLPQLPRRIEYIHRELRQKAGFESTEIDFLEDLRQEWTRFKPKQPRQLPHSKLPPPTSNSRSSQRE